MIADSQPSWPKIPLGEVAEFRNGVNFSKKNFGRGIRVIGVGDFQNNVCASYDDLEEINPNGVVRDEHLLRNGDIIFVRSNGNRELIGRSMYVDNLPGPVTHSAFSIRLRFTTTQKCDPRFYAYLFRSQLIRQSLSLFGGGTNISNLNQEILSRLEVPVPPFQTQERIASILSAYDDLMENNAQNMIILEQMAQVLYREWFVNFRFPGHDKANMVESEIGLIPEGWQVISIGQLLKFHIGGGWGEEERSAGYPHKAFVIRGTDIPQARVGILSGCPLRYHKESSVTPRMLETWDVVFEVSGGSKGQPVGRALLIHPKVLSALDSEIICASFCKLLRIDSSKIGVCHFYQFLLDSYVNGQIEKYQVQSTGITNFKFAVFLENAKIIIPPESIRMRFEDLCLPLMDVLFTLGRKNQNLRQTRDLLLPKLVSGEVSVEQAEKEVTAKTV